MTAVIVSKIGSKIMDIGATAVKAHQLGVSLDTRGGISGKKNNGSFNSELFTLLRSPYRSDVVDAAWRSYMGGCRLFGHEREDASGHLWPPSP